MTDQRPSKPGNGLPSDFGAFAPAIEYFTDAAQRAVLFFDVMRQRGNAYREHAAQTAPHGIGCLDGANEAAGFNHAAGVGVV